MPLLHRIMELQAELVAAKNPIKSIAISPAMCAQLAAELGQQPEHKIGLVLGMLVQDVPDFAIIDESGQMHVK